MMTSSSKVLKTCTVSLTKRMRDYDHIDFSQKLVDLLEIIIIFIYLHYIKMLVKYITYVAISK